MTLEVLTFVEPVHYGEGLRLQEEHARSVLSDGKARLLLMRHYPVATFGIHTQEKDRVAIPQLNEHGVEVYDVSREGRGTYFEQGMMVAYPIMLLPPNGKEVHIVRLRRAARNYFETLRIKTRSSGDPQHPGLVYGSRIEPRKIAAIGAEFRRQKEDGVYVTLHGIVLYLNSSPPTDIMPLCGNAQPQVTSVAEILGEQVAMGEAMGTFARVFEAELRPRERSAPFSIDELVVPTAISPVQASH